MGCCVSTNTASKRSEDKSGKPPLHLVLEEEEEAVKEVVLSEAPTIPEHYPAAGFSGAAAQDKRNQNDAVRSNGGLSEICSDMSESSSVSTAVTEKRERYGEAREFRQRSKNREYSGEMKRDRIVGSSPGRRSEISSNGSGSGYGRKRDSGEISGRRSVSPAPRATAATSQTGLSRTQSARKTGVAPAPERIRKAEGEKHGERAPAPTPTENESLENPLVSLECFIFL
ncbi:uncharacterized protein LOC127247813 [Andrographis paniculata]|uniref:uncharacterized protein LOC127247813 n=1 Tax=Andrographis paniculata TaxID=175694 RepID=UPI0021E99F76|nr:uncharacterized protein LOC127247813 [Andrographis paniculata]